MGPDAKPLGIGSSRAPNTPDGWERQGPLTVVAFTDTLEHHNNWVRDNTPPDKFHVVELKDGWEPLCRILDKPIPNEPFPRANDADAVRELSKKIFMRALITWGGILAGTSVLGCGAWWAWKTLQ